MIISDLLPHKARTDIKSVQADCTLLDMARILERENIGVLIVLTEDGEIDGVVSERDLARNLIDFPQDLAVRQVREIMTRDVITCDVNDGVIEILSMMSECRIRHIPVLDQGTLASVLSLRDFTLAYQWLQTQVLTDYLTGLSNRRHFMAALDKEINRRTRFATSLSLIMIDIDHFKTINDTYGHNVGDQVIRAVADLLKAQCRIYDVIGRLGGEEYAILCPNTALQGARIMGERLIAAMRQSVVFTDAGPVHFTASFGIYETTAADEDAKTIIGCADAFLYEAKEAGRDRIVGGTSERFSPDGAAASQAVAAQTETCRLIPARRLSDRPMIAPTSSSEA